MGIVTLSMQTPPTCHTRRSKTFSLTELLVVLALGMVLISMIVPAMRTSIELTEELECRMNLRNMGMGVFQYAEDYQDVIPGRGLASGWADPSWWYWCIYPYVTGKTAENPFYPPNQSQKRNAICSYRSELKVFTCPSVHKVFGPPPGQNNRHFMQVWHPILVNRVAIYAGINPVPTIRLRDIVRADVRPYLGCRRPQYNSSPGGHFDWQDKHHLNYLHRGGANLFRLEGSVKWGDRSDDYGYSERTMARWNKYEYWLKNP